MSKPSNPPRPERNVSPGYPDSYPGGYPDGYPSAVSAGDLTRDLRSAWFLLRDRLWLIGLIMLVGVSLAAAYLLVHPKMFDATATVQVERQDKSAISAEDRRSDQGGQSGLEQLNTIVEKFHSRPLLAAVLVEAGLIPSNSVNVLSLELADTAATAGAETVALPTNPVQAAASAVTNASVSAAASPTNLDNLASFGKVNDFGLRVQVKLRRNTRLIDITIRDRDPRLAARLANLMVENYLHQDFSIKSSASKSQGEYFKAEYDRMAKKLQASEQALQDYREKMGTVEVADPGNPQNQNDELMECQRQLAMQKVQVISLESAYQESLKMGTNIDDLLAYPQISNDPQIQMCQTAIAQKKAEFVSLKQQYRDKHPRYVQALNTLAALDEQLTKTVLDIRNRIQQSFRLPYENAQKTLKGLQTEMDRIQVKSLDLSQKGIHYNLLAREVTSDRAMFDAVSQRLNEMSVNSELAPVNISLIGPADPPLKPSSPKVRLILVLALVGSFGLAVFVILAMDKFNTALRTVDDAEAFLPVPVLAAIPQLDIDQEDFASKLVFATHDPHSAEAEIIRTLRASLTVLNRTENQVRRTFLFTSSFPKEGKTFTSCNFAASLAQQGLRTVVLDLDLRRPRLEEFLTGATEHRPGLTELLQGNVRLAEVCQAHPKLPNLFWVAAGAMVSNPSELLSQGAFEPVLAQALQEYDRVVIDTPPLHPVKDALLLVHLVDDVVVLADGSKTPRKAVAKTVQWLMEAQAPVTGVVLNFLARRRKGQGYYYYDYQGYSYGKYGEDKQPARKSSKSRK